MDRWLRNIEVIFLQESKSTSSACGRTVVISGLLEMPPLPPASTTTHSSGSFPLPAGTSSSTQAGESGPSSHRRRVVAVWNSQAQRFDSVTVPGTPATSPGASPRRTVSGAHSSETDKTSRPCWLDHLPEEIRERFPVISEQFKAHCVYGVVETGLSQVLVVVTKLQRCSGVKLPATGGGVQQQGEDSSAGMARNHEVYKIEEVRVVSLPAGTPAKSPGVGPTDRSEKEHQGSDTTSRQQGTSSINSAGNKDGKSTKAQEKAAAMYVDLIQTFFSGGSDKINMFLSFSLDLTHPMEKALPNTAPPSLSSAFGSLKQSASIQSVDQWGFAKDSEVSGPAASPAVVVDPTTLPSRNEFRWNAHLLSRFAIDLHVLCPPVIRGFIGSAHCMNHFCTSPAVPQPEINVVLIARQSAMNPGTRYNRRGINGDGVPGNFTETEQVVFTVTAETDECVGLISSIRVVRGSVPVQWQQQPDFDLKPTPKIRSSPAPSSAQPSSDNSASKQVEELEKDLTSSHRHKRVSDKPKSHGHQHDLAGLEKELGNHIQFMSQLYPEMAEVYCLDLMDTRHPKEGPLCEAYSAAMQSCMSPLPTSDPTSSSAAAGPGGDSPNGQEEGESQKDEEIQTEDKNNITIDSAYSSIWSYNAFNLGKELHRCAKAKRSIWGSFGDCLPRNPDAYRASVMEIVPKLSLNSSTPNRVSSPTRSLSTPTLSTPNRARTAIFIAPQNGIALSQSADKRQTFLLRVNCLDCLDRTNVTQFAYGTEMLKRQIAEQIVWAQNQQHNKDEVINNAAILSTDTPKSTTNKSSKTSSSSSSQQKEGSHDEAELAMMKKVMIDNLSSDYKQLWVGHGNAISNNYAGSDALLRDVIETGLRTGRGKLSDGKKAISRYIQQHFLDGRKQDGILLVTGKHDPSSISTTNPLERRMGALNLVVPGGAALGWVGLLVSAFITFTWTSSPRWWMACLMMNLWLVHAVVTSVLFKRDAQSYIDMPLLPSTEPKEVSLKTDED